MLARAALRSLSIRAAARSVPPSSQSRFYAKGPPPKPYEYKPPTRSRAERHGPTAQTSSEPIGKIARGDFEGAKPASPSQGASDHVEKRGDTDSTASDSSDDASQVSSSRSKPPLPDLTQGIPSTIASEIAAANAKSNSENLDVAETLDSGEKGEGRDLPRSAYISSFERRRNRWANYFYAFTFIAATGTTVFLGRNWETEEEERLHPNAPSGWGLRLFYNRARARLSGTLDYYNEPAFAKLLPNPEPAWERPYTLVLSLEDLLVHSEWDREHGWRMAKRPGADYFLRYLSQYYELVIFTSVPSMIGQPVINKLDPYHIVMWPLFREATRYKNGKYIKDLTFLNRPLNKIIMLDTDPSHAGNQPENAIILKKWKGDPKDKELVSFIPFLEYVASMEFNDTRAVIKSFEGTHIPTEYGKREGTAREKWQKQIAAESGKGSKRRVSGLGGLFGMKSQGEGADQTLSEGFARGKMYQDQVRERGQKNYEILEKEIRENGEKWLKEMAEEEKKMNEEAMKGMRSSLTSYIPFSASSKQPPSTSASS